MLDVSKIMVHLKKVNPNIYKMLLEQKLVVNLKK